MIRPHGGVLRFVSTCVVFWALAKAASAQLGFGVDGGGQLFRFDVNGLAPAPTTSIGAPLPFVPEGIDFRPGTSTLFAIDVGPNTTQLYTIDINSGVPAAVGPGFNSVGIDYNLTTSNFFGFDFDPKSLQADDSMRIRLVNSANQNLRLNSTTGLVSDVDVELHIGQSSPFVDAVAYINNIAEMGGSTTLFDMDSRNNALFIQSPPNNGDLTEVGSFGLTIDAIAPMHFDVYTDPMNGDNFAYAVYRRHDAPMPGPTGAYLLYNVNLFTGQTFMGRLVGDDVTPANFDGGFAVLPVPIPEPAGASLLLCGAAALAIATRRRVAKVVAS